MLDRSYEKLSSKERVRRVMHGEIPDRVPINYFANAGIDARLKAELGIAPSDDEALRRALGVDFRGIGAPYGGKILHTPIEGRIISQELGYHLRWVEHESGGYHDYCDFPLADADIDEIAAWPLATADDYDYSCLEADCAKFGEYALHVGNAGLACIINTAGFMRGMEQVLIDLVTDDPAGLLLIDRFLDTQLKVTQRILERVKRHVDFMWIGEDLGTQHTPLISMNILKKHIIPKQQPFFELAKAYDLPVMMHTCGSSSWAYPEYIKIGLNGVDTLQPEATNMSARYLKDTFSGRLFFHGCMSTAGALAYGGQEDVKREVRDILDIMMPNGGYCFAPTHSIQDNTPTENALIAYDEALRMGKY